MISAFAKDVLRFTPEMVEAYEKEHATCPGCANNLDVLAQCVLDLKAVGMKPEPLDSRKVMSLVSWLGTLPREILPDTYYTGVMNSLISQLLWNWEHSGH